MRRATGLARLLAAALAFGACHGSQAKDSVAAAAPADAAFGAKVRAYLLAHPEVIEEAVERLQANQAADQAAQEKAAAAKLPALRRAIERDPRDFVANPAGHVTVTEFYDYRCPHCVNAAPKVLAMIRRDPDVRFVFKEMPIFGEVSQRAARAALAVKKSGGDSLGLYQALMSTRGLDRATIDALALAHGATRADIDANPAADQQMADTASLFAKLDLGGTPAFIIGDDIVYGEDMDAVAADVAKAKAAQARGQMQAARR